MPRLTYEQLLSELQALVGKDVLVRVASIHEEGFPVVSLSGELRKAESSAAFPVLQQLGGAPPDDEALMFHVGGADAPAEKTGFTLLRSRFQNAERSPGPFGEEGLSFVCSSIRFMVVSREEAEKHLPQPPAGS